LSTETGHIDHQGKKMGMWFFLFTEILFFGGMFLLYSIYRYKYSQDFHNAAAAESIVLGTVNTAILLTSSLCIALSISAVRRGERFFSSWLQLVTIVMGVSFLVIKYFEWMAKIDIGIYPDSPVLLKMAGGEILFFGLYYVMTGLHGLHVVAGLVLIGIMLALTVRKRITSNDQGKLENAGLYWHLVDLIWIYLFPLFYLIT